MISLDFRMMNLTEKLTVRSVEQNEENSQLYDEISFLRSEYLKNNSMKPIQKFRNDTSLVDDEGDILVVHFIVLLSDPHILFLILVIKFNEKSEKKWC